MSAKRAAGAGRKPKGPIKGKTSNFSTRITSETRADLERLAKANGHSLSQVVEALISEALKKDQEAPPHIRALARAVTLLAVDIENRTGNRWVEDPFTGESLRHATNTFLLNLVPLPDGEVLLPPQLEQQLAGSPEELRKTLRDPASFGALQANALTFAIESAPLTTTEQPGMIYPAPSGLSFIRENISVQKSRKIT